MPESFTTLSDEEKSARLLDYVKGRLTEDQRKSVEDAVAADEALATELAYYQGLSNAEDPAEDPTDHSFAWARLSKAIDDDIQSNAPPQKAANDNSPVWRIASFALGLVALVQAGLLFSPGQFSGSDEPIYVPVAEDAGYVVRVIFAEDALVSDISDLFSDLEGQIVDGPSAIGLYDIGFASETAQTTALQTLQEATDLIESATLP